MCRCFERAIGPNRQTESRYLPELDTSVILTFVVLALIIGVFRVLTHFVETCKPAGARH